MYLAAFARAFGLRHLAVVEVVYKAEDNQSQATKLKQFSTQALKLFPLSCLYDRFRYSARVLSGYNRDT